MTNATVTGTVAGSHPTSGSSIPDPVASAISNIAARPW